MARTSLRNKSAAEAHGLAPPHLNTITSLHLHMVCTWLLQYQWAACRWRDAGMSPILNVMEMENPDLCYFDLCFTKLCEMYNKSVRQH